MQPTGIKFDRVIDFESIGTIAVQVIEVCIGHGVAVFVDTFGLKTSSADRQRDYWNGTAVCESNSKTNTGYRTSFR
jgi:hypothetical protein